MERLDAYNSDKIRLQESVKKVYDTLKSPQEDNSSYRAIEEETDKLMYRQEAIYRMVSTIAIISVLITVYRGTV